MVYEAINDLLFDRENETPPRRWRRGWNWYHIHNEDDESDEFDAVENDHPSSSSSRRDGQLKVENGYVWQKTPIVKTGRPAVTKQTLHLPSAKSTAKEEFNILKPWKKFINDKIIEAVVKYTNQWIDESNRKVQQKERSQQSYHNRCRVNEILAVPIENCRSRYNPSSNFKFKGRRAAPGVPAYQHSSLHRYCVGQVEIGVAHLM